MQLRRVGLVLGILLAVAASSARSDESSARKWYEQRLEKLGRTAAQRLWEAAERARKEMLFRYAREEASRALEYDPEHRLARQFLGYVKRDDGWQIDPETHAKLVLENQTPPGGRKLADSEEAWKRVIAVKADADVAAYYAAFGDECATKGFAKEAQTAYAKALQLDATNAAAHTGVGHVRFAEALWISREAQRAFDASRVVTPVEGASRWEETVGVSMAKAHSVHFHCESPLGAASVEKYLVAAERAYAAWFGDLGLDAQQTPLPTSPLPMFCVVADDEQWNRWIDRIAFQNPGLSRDLPLHWARDRWAVAVRSVEPATDDARVDRIEHQTVHLLNVAVYDLPQGCWLDEALAYRCPVLLAGTTRHFCIPPQKSESAGADATRNWLDAAQWKAMLKASVAKGDDLALRAIVTGDAFQLPIAASVKAWSVLDHLLARDRSAVTGMLRDLRGLKDPKQCISPLETRFGAAVESIDDEWRKWVLATY
jgi:tetratricopeptide (TPR) repeat protein